MPRCVHVPCCASERRAEETKWRGRGNEEERSEETKRGTQRTKRGNKKTRTILLVPTRLSFLKKFPICQTKFSSFFHFFLFFFFSQYFLFFFVFPTLPPSPSCFEYLFSMWQILIFQNDFFCTWFWPNLVWPKLVTPGACPSVDTNGKPSPLKKTEGTTHEEVRW